MNEQTNTETPKNEKPKRFWAVLIVVDILLMLAFGWMLYTRFSLHQALAFVQPETGSENITRPEMPKPTELPEQIPIPQSTETVTAPDDNEPLPVQAVEKNPETKQADVPAKQEPKKSDPSPVAPLPKADGTGRGPAKLSSSEADRSAVKQEKKPETAKPEKKMISKEPGKAQRMDFEYKNPKAQSVAIAGSFTKWEAKKMKQEGETWRISLFIHPGKYPYHFVADGKKTPDPLQPLKQKGESLLIVIPSENVKQ